MIHAIRSVAAMVVLRVCAKTGMTVPFAKIIEGVLTILLIGYFFLMLTQWQDNVQKENEASG